MADPSSTPNTTPGEDNHLFFIFQKKYLEFTEDLKGAVPEYIREIESAACLSPEDRLGRFVEEVLPNCPPTRDATKCPGLVLPGVTITETVWGELSETSKNAIQEYLSLLSFCSLFGGAKNGIDESGLPNREWTDQFLKTWKDKLSSVDFEGISKKLADLFGDPNTAFPKMAEKMMKGHLGKIAEELVREFTPEDFGLTPEQLAACEKDPSKTFELLTDIYTRRPELIQKAIQRIASRIQEKIRRGELRPEQIVAEAEEMMKQFSENKAFVELMEGFRSAFGMDDLETAREAGREGDARRNIVKERLRKKLAAKKAGAAGQSAPDNSGKRK